jgi:hypothetical protein
MSTVSRKNPRPAAAGGAASEPPAAIHDDSHAGSKAPEMPVEIGGRAGPEPTRFGDWEKNGRCIDF